MNRFRVVALLAVLLIVLFGAANSFAEGRTGGYIVLKPGVFIPTNDLKDRGFDKTFSGEIAVGNYYSPNLALEAGVGYFQTESSKSGADFTEEDDIWVIPVTITFKGVLPFRGGELNAGVGPGVYFANIEAKGTSALTGSFSNDGHAVAVGGHAVVGANIDITRRVFVGAEGKYIFTTGAHLLDSKVKLNGFIGSGLIGYRF